jgi:hypothetical protein
MFSPPQGDPSVYATLSRRFAAEGESFVGFSPPSGWESLWAGYLFTIIQKKLDLFKRQIPANPAVYRYYMSKTDSIRHIL